MKLGYLSQYFEGIAVKRLSEVEVNLDKSHQHEFNGAEALCSLLGEPVDKVTYKSKFFYFSDLLDNPFFEEGFMTWSDVRRKARIERKVMRWEYHLYYSSMSVIGSGKAGDLLIVAKLKGEQLIALVVEAGSIVENQLKWLFGIRDDLSDSFEFRKDFEGEESRLGYAARSILEKIGIEVLEEQPDFLKKMLTEFNGGFPTTRKFSEFARKTLREIHDSKKNPDETLLAWMSREEALFKTLERALLGNDLNAGRICKGAEVDVDAFISLSLSVHNRRKSRVGNALENHLEQVFKDHGITCSRTKVTELKRKPDFIFPGIAEYHDARFPDTRLTMLASKSTCKDRWRQILNEAKRIDRKHLFTLETSISVEQTDEMKDECVQLVLPSSLHNTFKPAQQKELLSLEQFIELAKSRQSA